MVKSLELKIYPDKILRQQTAKIDFINLDKAELSRLLLDMEQTMKDNDGIGLAAPQIGKSISLAIIKTEEGFMPLINPKITRRSWKKDVVEEGCLSIPQVFGTVKRPVKIWVSTQDLNGQKVKFTANGMFARVIQHETDHTNGILFAQRVLEQKGPFYQSATDEDGKEILEEVSVS